MNFELMEALQVIEMITEHVAHANMMARHVRDRSELAPPRVRRRDCTYSPIMKHFTAAELCVCSNLPRECGSRQQLMWVVSRRQAPDVRNGSKAGTALMAALGGKLPLATRRRVSYIAIVTVSRGCHAPHARSACPGVGDRCCSGLHAEQAGCGPIVAGMSPMGLHHFETRLGHLERRRNRHPL